MKNALENSATKLWHTAKAQLIALTLLALLSTINSQLSTAFAQGTAFSYQGRLNDGGNPANGIYDLGFAIYDSLSGGTQQGNTITNTATAVSNGLFTVTLDFGNQFPGAGRWLEISARTNGAATFVTLAPRQALTSTPYSIQSASAATAASASSVAAGNITGTLNAAQLPSGIVTNGSSAVNISGTFSGDGGGLTDLSAAQLTSIGNTNGGTENVFVGPAGNATTTGSQNTAIGVGALNDNTSGSGNTACGLVGLYFNTSGYYNTANGYATLFFNTIGSLNTANGYEALYFNTSGNGNTADGFSSLSSNTNGSYNTAEGYGALYSETSGSNNIALGSLAGFNITTGSSNIDIGNQGLAADTNTIRIGDVQTQTFIAGVINGDGGGLTDLNVSAAQLTSIGNDFGAGNFFVGPSGNAETSGFQNTGNGVNALLFNTSGSDNTANGFDALYNNASGSDNTANGDLALANNTSGVENTASGSGALLFNTSGAANTANGYFALYNNTVGSFNTANGIQALYSNTSGSNNTANGFNALFSNTSASYNAANGVFALANNTSGSFNTANGPQALAGNTIGSFNTANGFNALLVNINGVNNTANGTYALYSNTNGSANTADGVAALPFNTSGSNNIALGYQAGFNITTGSSNIDIGNQGLATDTNIIRIGTGQTQTFIAGTITGDGGGLSNLNVSAAQLSSIGNTNGGADNFYVGPSGNAASSGSFDTAEGVAALNSNTGGSDNTADGYQALFSNTVGNDNTADGFEALYHNINGSLNTAIGYDALVFNTSGSVNTAIGIQTLFSNTNGSFNTALGHLALFGNTSGSYNLALGYEAGAGITTGSSNIDIGNGGLSTDTNIIRIGSGQTQTFIAGTINGNGTGLTGVALLNVTNTFTGNQNFTGGGIITLDNKEDIYAKNTSGGIEGLLTGRYSDNATYFTFGSGGLFIRNYVDAVAMYVTTNGNVGIGTTAPTNKLEVVGGVTFTSGLGGANQSVVWVPGSASWSFTSDRNTKEHIEAVDARSILEKVTRIPVKEWSYIGYEQRHIGPMAQDFHEQFPLSQNDKVLNDADLHGVALAAIQGLNEKVEDGSRREESQIETLKAENADLKARLEKLEQIINARKGNE